MMQTILPVARCLSCGEPFDAVTGIDPNTQPNPGDISLCFYCGYIMVFDLGLGLRQLTNEEMYDVAANPDLLRAQRTRSLLRRL